MYVDIDFFTIIIILGTAYLSLGRRGCHSVSKMMNQTDIRIKILPALSDNYMYLVSSVGYVDMPNSYM